MGMASLQKAGINLFYSHVGRDKLSLHQLEWHLRLSDESEQTPGDGGGQESLVRCSPWGRKEWGMIQGLNNTPTALPPRPSPALRCGLFPCLVSDPSRQAAPPTRRANLSILAWVIPQAEEPGGLWSMEMKKRRK